MAAPLLRAMVVMERPPALASTTTWVMIRAWTSTPACTFARRVRLPAFQMRSPAAPAILLEPNPAGIQALPLDLMGFAGERAEASVSTMLRSIALPRYDEQACASQ